MDLRLVPGVVRAVVRKWGLMPLACVVKRLPLRLLLCDVDVLAVPASTRFTHPLGIVIGAGVHLGENCHIRQNVTVGGVGSAVPSIGDGVEIGAGAILLGPIQIGARARIGAGAVVLEDVPPGVTVVSEHRRRAWPNRPAREGELQHG